MSWEISRGEEPRGGDWEPFAVENGEVLWRRASDPPRHPNALATPREVADILRVDIATLRRLIRAGSIPAPLHIGRALRWNLPDLFAALRR